MDTDKTARDYLENWRTDLEKMQAMENRIAELEHYNLGLATEVQGLEYELAEAYLRIYQLEAQLVEAQKDAERYRWLMDNHSIGLTKHQTVVLHLNPELNLIGEPSETLEQAIDRTMGGDTSAGDK